MCSEGVGLTAGFSRASQDLVASTVEEYRMLLPVFPASVATEDTLVLHADLVGRPYRLEDFKAPLLQILTGEDLACLGPYKFNHLWIVTLRTKAARDKLLKKERMTVKGKTCLILNPKESVVKIKIHWLPFHGSNGRVTV